MSSLHLWEINNPMLLSSFIPRGNSSLTSLKKFLDSDIYNEIEKEKSILIYFKWFREQFSLAEEYDQDQPGNPSHTNVSIRNKNKTYYNGLWLFFIHHEERLNIIITLNEDMKLEEEKLLKEIIQKHKFNFGI
jgi:hypothetical protein